MTRNRFAILLIAVLTAMLLAGCGNETTMESSAPEGLQTFGVAVNPSTAPSQGQTVEVTPGSATVKDPAGNTTGQESGGNVGETDNQGQGGTSTPTAPAAPSTQKPSTPSTSNTPVNPTTGPDAPAISPPAPASTATPDEVEEYVGKSLSELIADLGVPSSSDYELIDETDPDAGEIGTLYFNGFTVTTKRTADGEIITEVNEEDPEPSPGE